MARATSKAGYGSGWHKESLRHSNARKTGRAGGIYVDRNLNGSLVVSDGRNKMVYYGYSKKDALSKFKKLDSDGDGVPDSKDCQPYNPHAQDTELLKPEYSRQKSFYKKAKVETDQGQQKLYSYGTLVAEIKNGKPIVYGTYSQTTLRHIKEFLAQNGHKAETSKQIIKDYSPSDKDMEAKQKEATEKSESMMKTTAMVASLGELFGKTQKEKNDWKTRMLKAGAPQLSIPDDWETLPEAEKERRLNQVIAVMQEKKKPTFIPEPYGLPRELQPAGKFKEEKKKIPKTKEEFVIQGHYGSGWEDVTSEDKWSEAKARLKEYRDNEPQYPHRRITRRVPNPEYKKE